MSKASRRQELKMPSKADDDEMRKLLERRVQLADERQTIQLHLLNRVTKAFERIALALEKHVGIEHPPQPQNGPTDVERTAATPSPRS